MCFIGSDDDGDVEEEEEDIAEEDEASHASREGSFKIDSFNAASLLEVALSRASAASAARDTSSFRSFRIFLNSKSLEAYL